MTNLILDVSNLVWRAHYSTGSLSFGNSTTGALFGFIKTLYMLDEHFSYIAKKNIFFAFDSKISKRRKLYPKYKSTRRERVLSPQEEIEFRNVRKQIKKLKSLLKQFYSHNIYRETGYEADDVIAGLVAASKQVNESVIIVSNDQDLYQLLSPMVSIFNAHNKTLITEESFSKEWGIIPKRWPDVKAIAGCKTDDVPGIKGVGEKTAIKYLNGQMKKTVLSGVIDNWVGSPWASRNLRLVTLPFEGFPCLNCEVGAYDIIPNAQKYPASAAAWNAQLNLLGMSSLLLSVADVQKPMKRKPLFGK